MDANKALPKKKLVVVLLAVLIYCIDDVLVLADEPPPNPKNNSNRQKIIKILGENNLTEEYITEYCIKKGIPKISETIYLFLNNTLEETAEILSVDPSTITRRILSFLKNSPE